MSDSNLKLIIGWKDQSPSGLKKLIQILGSVGTTEALREGVQKAMQDEKNEAHE